MPRKFTVYGRSFNHEHDMSIAAIGRVEDAFGQSALQIVMKLQKEWLEKDDEGKMRMRANKIRLADACKLIAAATESTPEEVAASVQGDHFFESAFSVLVAFCDEALLLVQGKEDPAAKEPLENPLPAADALTSGG